MTNRRSFLKVFGVSSAAVASVDGIERVADPAVKALESAPSGSLPFPRSSYVYDVTSDVLYSAVDIEKNGMRERYDLFSDTISQSVTRAQTNMLRQNALPEPSMFCVKRIGFAFSPKTEPGLRSAFCDRYHLNFQIASKSYWRQPLSFCFGKGEPDRERGFATAPDLHMVELELPLIIDMGMYFTAQVIGTPIQPCGKLRGWAVLGGLHARAIQ